MSIPRNRPSTATVTKLKKEDKNGLWNAEVLELLQNFAVFFHYKSNIVTVALLGQEIYTHEARFYWHWSPKEVIYRFRTSSCLELKKWSMVHWYGPDTLINFWECIHICFGRDDIKAVTTNPSQTCGDDTLKLSLQIHKKIRLHLTACRRRRVASRWWLEGLKSAVATVAAYRVEDLGAIFWQFWCFNWFWQLLSLFPRRKLPVK